MLDVDLFSYILPSVTLKRSVSRLRQMMWLCSQTTSHPVLSWMATVLRRQIQINLWYRTQNAQYFLSNRKHAIIWNKINTIKYSSLISCLSLILFIEEFTWGKGAHYQTAKGGTETPRSQTSTAQETATEPDPKGEHSTEGKNKVVLIPCYVLF